LEADRASIVEVLAMEEHFLQEPVQALEAFAVQALEALHLMLEVGTLAVGLYLA